jgi:hypothetical protein
MNKENSKTEKKNELDDIVPEEEKAPNNIEMATPKQEKFQVSDEDYTLEIVADYNANVDPFYLDKKDPTKEYRFLRADEKNLSIKTGNMLLQKGGWQICGRKHLEKIGIKPKDIAPDGVLRRGDTVLAFMPKDLFKKKEEYKAEKANAPVNAVQRMIKGGDQSHEVGRGIHSSMKGIQTKEALKM